MTPTKKKEVEEAVIPEPEPVLVDVEVDLFGPALQHLLSNYMSEAEAQRETALLKDQLGPIKVVRDNG